MDSCGVFRDLIRNGTIKSPVLEEGFRTETELPNNQGENYG